MTYSNNLDKFCTLKSILCMINTPNIQIASDYQLKMGSTDSYETKIGRIRQDSEQSGHKWSLQITPTCSPDNGVSFDVLLHTPNIQIASDYQLKGGPADVVRNKNFTISSRF